VIFSSFLIRNSLAFVIVQFAWPQQKTHRPSRLWRWVRGIQNWIQLPTELASPSQKAHVRTLDDNNIAPASGSSSSRKAYTRVSGYRNPAEKSIVS